MKINKKGFTLIELLAVIAILGILVVVAVPAVLDLFNTARKDSFVSQTQEIFKAAEQKSITDQIGGGPSLADEYCFVPKNFSSGNPEDSDAMLDLSKNNVAYKVNFTDGKVTSIIVVNGDSYIALTNANGLSISDINKDEMNDSTTLPAACDGTWPTATAPGA